MQVSDGDLEHFSSAFLYRKRYGGSFEFSCRLPESVAFELGYGSKLLPLKLNDVIMQQIVCMEITF